jgi:hypothetical protein
MVIIYRAKVSGESSTLTNTDVFTLLVLIQSLLIDCIVYIS